MSHRISAARLIATGFGTGYSPVVPGTAGSLGCLAVWYALWGLGVQMPLLLFVAVTTIGAVTTARCLKELEAEGKVVKDPSFIVIDEWAGLLVALAAATPCSHTRVLLAFLLFRIFDMTKPGPIGWVERLPGAWGVMADDLLAGLISAGLLMLLPAIV